MFNITFGLKAFRWDIMVALLIGGVIAAPMLPGCARSFHIA
jgi:hypothetical protein